MTDTAIIEREEVKLKRPSKWVVVLHNDDVTPMDFVVLLLHDVFGHTIQQSALLTMKVHEEGSAVAGVYSYEVAEQKHNEAVEFTKAAGCTLKLTLEEE